MTPRLDDIRRDDAFLDALGGRRADETPLENDIALAMLAQWVDAIDHTPNANEVQGRYARTGSRRLVVTARGAAAAVGFAVATLSLSSVAAAVTGTSMPVFKELGTVTRGLVGGHEVSTPNRATETLNPAPSESDQSAAATTDDESGEASTTFVVGPSSDPASAPSQSSTQWVQTSTGWQRRTTGPMLPTSSGTSATSTSALPTSTSAPTSTTKPSPTSTSPTSTSPADKPTSTRPPTKPTSTSQSPSSTKTSKPKPTKTNTRPSKTNSNRPIAPSESSERQTAPPSQTPRVLPTPSGPVTSDPTPSLVTTTN